MSVMVFWGFVIIAGLYALLHLIVLVLFAVYKAPSVEKGAYTPFVSVVIASHNASENLQKLIPSLLQQNYPWFEIIVVDDRSTDDTYDVFIHESKQNEKLKFLSIENTPNHINEKKYALTLGIKAAKADIILLTDADCLPAHPNWILRMVQPFANDKVLFSLGYSPYRAKKSILNAFIRYETLITGLTYLGLALAGRPYMGVGRNMAYRKSFFLSKNGFGKFQSVLGGDDDLFVNQFANKNNTGIVMHPESLVYSEPKTSVKSYFIQKTRHMSAGRHYRLSDKIILGSLIILKVGFYGTFLLAVSLAFKPYLVFSGFLISVLIFKTSLYYFVKKTGDPKYPWLSVFYEIWYLFYYFTVAVKVKFTRKIRWS
ncbi:MAG: glycosyltransferase [Cyclobacteriaceae bacterium]|nr:glycosyltransferase [Cyclobacteriaceae bacterium]